MLKTEIFNILLHVEIAVGEVAVVKVAFGEIAVGEIAVW